MGITKAYCPEISELNLLSPVLLDELSQSRQARITITRGKSQIRYRYPNFTWQTKKADDYSLTEIKKQCSNIQYVYRYGQAIISGGELGGWREFTSSSRRPPFSNIRLYINGSLFGTTDPVNSNLEHWGFLNKGIPPDGDRNRRYTAQFTDGNGRNVTLYNGFSQGHKVFGFEPKYPEQAAVLCPSDWKFQAYKCGQLVYQETREEKPEVIIENCVLDIQNQQIIDLNLAPFEILCVSSGVNNISDILNIINLINSALDALPFQNDDLFINYLQNLLGGNESECILIFTYKPGSSINIVRQICSTCNCPPPQYTVECDAQICPENTHCQIECEDFICCYDSEGFVLETIYK